MAHISAGSCGWPFGAVISFTVLMNPTKFFQSELMEYMFVVGLSLDVALAMVHSSRAGLGRRDPPADGAATRGSRS